MEGEVEPLILAAADKTQDSFLPRCDDDLHQLKQQQQQQQHEIQAKKRAAICSNVESCGLSEKCGREADKVVKDGVSRRLWLAAAFCIALLAVEVVGGFLANSLAILADAAHLLSDVASFGVSLFAIWASGWSATPRLSYGFHRLETLGALLSIVIIWIITGVLVYEAIFRLVHDLAPVDGKLMFFVAALGFAANLVMVYILGRDHHAHAAGKHRHDHGDHRCLEICKQEQAASLDLEDIKSKKVDAKEADRHRNLNLRGAYLHILGDLIQSAGVLIGGAIIWRYPRLRFVDVICTLVFSVVVLWTTVALFRDVVEILMESSPREIQLEAVKSGLELVHPDVLGVHELHIWSVTSGKVLLSVHVAVKDDADPDLVLERVIGYCNADLNIRHVTVQIERERGTCVDQV